MTDQTTRAIWESTDNILLIYLGSSADFALNKENDWLFFTNALPSNPQKRFLETFKYNKAIILASQDELQAIAQRIRNVHTSVEQARSRKENHSMRISNEAYKLVGDMLIDYGIKGYEYLHRIKLTDEQKENYYKSCANYFKLLGIQDIEETYAEFQWRRSKSILNDLQQNKYTQELYNCYKRDLGPIKFWAFKQFQAYFVDKDIAERLSLKRNPFFYPIYKFYPFLRSGFTLELLELFFLKPESKKALDEMESFVGHI